MSREGAIMGSLGGIEITLIVVGMLVFFVIPLIALVDILKSEFEGYNKLIWVLVILFLWIIGAILYYFIGRKQKIA